MLIKQEQFYFDAVQSHQKIHAMLMMPEGVPRAAVQITHGMAEHKQRYVPLMEALVEAGYAAAIHDHRGHGRSAGSKEELGHFGDGGAAALVEDMFQLTRIINQRFPDAPLFLMGHSMGSLAARCYARKGDRHLSGLILIGSPVENPTAPAGLAMVRALRAVWGPRHYSKLVDRALFGHYNDKFPGESSDFAWLNSDASGVQAYDDDPLCGFLFTLNGYEGLITLMREAYSAKGWTVKNPGLPILMLSGADDPCMVSPDNLHAAAGHLRARGYTDVALKIYPGMRHEILNEPGRDQVIQDILSFLDAHTMPAHTFPA